MEVEIGQVQSLDGTLIATYGAGKKGAEVIVLANGLGGSFSAWRHLIAHFANRYRLISWDYRGLYRSLRPKEGSEGAFSMERQCEDLEALLQAEGVEKAIFIGWSMGVQVCLEEYRRRPECFLAMVLINGTYGRPFDTAFRAHWMREVGPVFLEFMPLLTPLFRRVEPLVARTRTFIALAKAIGLVSPTLDEEVFFDLASQWLNLDFDAYSKTFKALAHHNAYDVLGKVKVPVLVITGEKDLFTPMELSARIVSEIPHAELFVIEGGSHYTPIEYPVAVNLRIQRFIEERVEKKGNGKRKKR